MSNVINYRPAQPFFELTTENYESRLTSARQQLAQYYSFVISPDAKESVVAVPDGSIDILFHCSSSKPQALVCGSVKKGKRVEFAKGNLYFGARFYPGKANLLLNCPLDQFTEKEITLSDVQKRPMVWQKRFALRAPSMKECNCLNSSTAKWRNNFLLRRWLIIF